MQHSIVNFKTIQKNNDGFRYDAEYFQRDFLVLEDLLEKKKSISLCDLVKKIDVGHVGSMVSEYSDDGVLLLQTQNVQEFFLNLDGCKRINVAFHVKLKKSQIHYGDILIARSGSFGNASIYLEKDTINSADIIIVEGDIRKINIFYLCAFFNSEIGKNQIYRFASGGLQGHVNLTILENLKIPVPSVLFQQNIERITKNAYLLKNKSENLYFQAAQMLLSELGLVNWKPKHRISFIKNFSDTQSADRIDAEYFQPMYEEVVEAVNKYKGGANILEKFVSSYSTGFPFRSESYTEKGVYLIRINNIQKGRLELSNASKIPFEDVKLSKKDIARKNDILISMSGTIGNSCKIPKNIDAVINQRIFRFTPKNYNVDILPLVINSVIGFQQLNRIGTGGVQTNISGGDILNIKIPCLDKDVQNKIAEIVSESFRNRELSKQLLDIAKRGVEIAIEKSEGKAEAWIKKELTRLGVVLGQ